MELDKILSLIGLVLNFVGVLMMYKANPKIKYPLTQFPDAKALNEMAKDEARSKLFGAGLIFILIGIGFQMISLFADKLKCNYPYNH